VSDTSLHFLSLSAEALTSGRNHKRSVLSQTELTVTIQDGSNGRDVQILTGDHLAVSLCVDHIHHLLQSYTKLTMPISYTGGIEVSRTTVSCVLASCDVTLSCKGELSALIQASAKQVNLQARYHSDSLSLELAIASLGILDLSSRAIGPDREKVTMLVRARGDAGDDPNFSLALVFGVKSEMTIVLNRLCFALLPNRINEIISEFQTSKPNCGEKSGQSISNMKYMITCSQSEFIYSPEQLSTRLGIAIGL
jgi:hypothetical protein